MAGENGGRSGPGEHVVLCLHGWFGCAKAWQPLVPHLDQARFSYVFVDYRGYGDRRGVTGDYTIAEAAADVLGLADELGADRFSVVGHSMGGKVMQWVLAEAPGRVRALAGISPVPANGVPFDEQAWQLFAGAADDASSRRAIIDFSTGGRLTGVWLDTMVSQSLANSDRDAFAAYLPQWARTDFHDRVAGSQVPVKVIVGEHDPSLNEELMRATFAQWYPRLEIDVMPNAGHYAMDETPVALATSLEHFLAEH
jgi:pimeloyl-ACP methyl ester carboxylesterase